MHVSNETHDPALRSWVHSANVPAGDFPIQNLPFAVFRRQANGEGARGGVAIGGVPRRHRRPPPPQPLVQPRMIFQPRAPMVTAFHS